MRIAVVHSFYRSATPSGENRIVVEQVKALADRGHDVLLVRRDSDTIKGPWKVLRTASALVRSAGVDPSEEILDFRPDVVHVHNLFPSFGQKWITDLGVRVVATLHNYRPLCASGTLQRNGTDCTLCPDGQWWSSVRYACYRNSRIATLPMLPYLRRGLAGSPLFSSARRLIVLSERSRSIYLRYGAPEQRTIVVPNGMPEIPRPAATTREGWAYIGRLSPEKGVVELVGEWPEGVPLSIAGDGPTSDLVRKAIEGRPEIQMRGTLDPDAVNRLLSDVVGVVIPSRWAEGLPLVLGEALRLGTPVLARADNSAADFVHSHGGGAVYATPEELVQEVTAWPGIDTVPSPRDVFRQQWSLDTWVSRLESVYDEVAP